MTFDQLQRYRLAGEIIDALRTRRPWRILDAGSREGFLREFLREDAVVNLDREYFDGSSLVLGDVLSLPFPARSFDAVVSLDVLEHVPAARRMDFLDELVRVSAGPVVVSAPFASDAVVTAEKLVNDFCLRVNGRENPFLAEHLAGGLPREEEVAAWARDRGFASLTVPNAYLPRWTAMMCLNSYLASLPEPWDLIFRINEMYDREFSASDNRPPAYRRCFLFSRTEIPNAEALSRRLAAPGTSGSAEKEAWAFLGRLADSVAAGQKEKIANLDRQRAELGRLIATRDNEVRDLGETVGRIQEEKAAEAKSLAGIIEKRSSEVRELSRALEETGRALREQSAELERIRSSAAYKVYRATLGRLRKAAP